MFMGIFCLMLIPQTRRIASCFVGRATADILKLCKIFYVSWCQFYKELVLKLLSYLPLQNLVLRYVRILQAKYWQKYRSNKMVKNLIEKLPNVIKVSEIDAVYEI